MGRYPVLVGLKDLLVFIGLFTDSIWSISISQWHLFAEIEKPILKFI